MISDCQKRSSTTLRYLSVALLAAFATLATLVTLTTPSHAAPIPEGAECIGPAAMADPFAQAQAGGLDLPGNFVDCDVLINKTDPCSKPGPGPDPSGPGTDKCYDPKGKDDCKPASSEDPTPPSKDCYGSLDDTDCDDKLEQNSDTANSGDDTLKGVACDPPSSSSSGGKLTGSGGSKDCIDRAAPVDPEPGKRINYCDGPERPLSPDQPGYAAKDECADKTEPTNPKPADPSDPTPLGNQLSDSSPGYGSGTLIKDKLHSVMLKCGQLPMLPNDGKKPGPSPTDDCPAGSASVDPGPTPEPKPQPKPDPTPEPKPDPDEQGPAPQPAPDPNPDPEPDPEPKPASGSPNDDANDDFYDGGKNDSPPTPGPAPGPDDPQPPAQHGDNNPCDDKRPPKGNSGSGGGNHAPSKNPNQLPGNVLADPRDGDAQKAKAVFCTKIGATYICGTNWKLTTKIDAHQSLWEFDEEVSGEKQYVLVKGHIADPWTSTSTATEDIDGDGKPDHYITVQTTYYPSGTIVKITTKMVDEDWRWRTRHRDTRIYIYNVSSGRRHVDHNREVG